VGVLAPIRDYVEALIHPSALRGAQRAGRHRALIAPRLPGGFAAPLALTGLVTIAAAATGGIASFAAIWLVVVPFEAARSGSRRAVAAAAILTLIAAGLLVLLGAAHLLPAMRVGEAAAVAGMAVVSATLYATGLALRTAVPAGAGLWSHDAGEDRRHLMARKTNDAITRHGRDGGVLFASAAAESLFGAPFDALRGHGLFERVHVADRPAYLCAIRDAAAPGQSRSVEFRVRRDGIEENGHRNPQFVWIEMCCRPLTGVEFGKENRDEVVATLRDVSRRKQEQGMLEQSRAEAERANARKSRFLATMSHELRTPLNAIIGFAEMLMQDSVLALDQKRRSEYASLIYESGHHLLSVVNGILDISKIETDNFPIVPEPFAPAPVVAGCCELVALRAREAGVRLELDLDGNLPEIVADKRAFRQILLNLLSNAIRFSDRGGKVVVAAQVQADVITLNVEDSGVGMSEEDVERVGEPYFQALASYERRHGGTGLGLSIVKGLVRLHGGELTICSRLGQGTRVTVRLPVDCERVGATAAPFAAREIRGATSGEGRAVCAAVKVAAQFTAPSIVPEPLPDGGEMPVRKSA